MIELHLREDFRLLHEALIEEHAPAAILEEEAEVAGKLADRLRNSNGGTFLITGFRGVGKTTAVHQALRRVEMTSGEKVIDVVVPVARPAKTSALLFEVIRRLVGRLSESGVLRKFSPEIRGRLLTAYARTSLAYKQTASQSQERSTTYGLGGPVTASAGKGKVTIPLPKLSKRRVDTESLATELSFLAYTEADVEHDFLRIIELLSRRDAIDKSRPARIWAWLNGKPRSEPMKSKLVVVFDEIDKLIESEGGPPAFQDLLGGLKNLFGARGIHFIVVGGVDLHDRWLKESATADSLYRSVFAWQSYVGCSWSAPKRLLTDFAAGEGSEEPDLETLASYLEYRGRGVIRNVMYELNEMVDWDGGSARIVLDGSAEDRVRLLAELAETLRTTLGDGDRLLLGERSDVDRVRQLGFFTVDWVLRATDDRFTVRDVMEPETGDSLARILRPTEETVHKVLEALVAAGYLQVHERSREIITEGPDAERYPQEYELTPSLKKRLAVIARSLPQARAELGRSEDGASLSEGSDARKTIQDMLGDRYRVARKIGQAGFGAIWEAIDLDSNERVVVKVVRTKDDEGRTRGRREAEMLRTLQIGGVVQLVDVIEEPDRILVITNMVGGKTLLEHQPMAPEEAIQITVQLLNTVEQLHRREIVHADLKPSNVILGPAGPVVLDLGTAERIGASEPRPPGAVIGTRLYMAPEVLLGSPPTPASDVWSIGILLIELITGSVPEVRTPVALEEIIASLFISPPFAEAIRAALMEEPDRRPNATELRRMLEAAEEFQRDDE
jgi:Cdc6-like AAA superfamily ATPase